MIKCYPIGANESIILQIVINCKKQCRRAWVGSKMCEVRNNDSRHQMVNENKCEKSASVHLF